VGAPRQQSIGVVAVLIGGASFAGTLIPGIDRALEGTLTSQTRIVSSLFSGGDASAQWRLEAWGWVWSEGLNKPLGHGLGSFAQDYNGLNWYPHNVLLEAHYELGWVGTALVAVMVIASLRLVWLLYRIQGAELYLMGTVVGLSLVLKAGDFSTIGLWLFWLLLSSGIPGPRQRGVRPKAGILRARLPVYPGSDGHLRG
jgi:hypothetical protein